MGLNIRMGVLVVSQLTWVNTMSEDFFYLDALDCWLGYQAEQQVAAVTLIKDSDGSFSWLVWASGGTLGVFESQVDLGSFPTLIAAQEAAEQHLYGRSL